MAKAQLDRVATRDKILDAAEWLFAERGFTETSLREITRIADVNLASVNYHFGSKKALIQDVFARFCDVFVSELTKALDALDIQVSKQGQVSAEDVLGAVVGPALQLNQVRQEGTSVFMRLLARAYSETQGHMRRFIFTQYGESMRRLIDYLRRAVPELPPQELFWRLHFMLGAGVFTMTCSAALQDIAQSDYDETVDMEKILLRLVPFLAAGLSAQFNLAAVTAEGSVTSVQS